DGGTGEDELGFANAAKDVPGEDSTKHQSAEIRGERPGSKAGARTQTFRVARGEAGDHGFVARFKKQQQSEQQDTGISRDTQCVFYGEAVGFACWRESQHSKCERARRSEERRVGKECRSRAAEHESRK